MLSTLCQLSLQTVVLAFLYCTAIASAEPSSSFLNTSSVRVPVTIPSKVTVYQTYYRKCFSCEEFVPSRRSFTAFKSISEEFKIRPFIAEINKPSRRYTRNVVIAFAGQQPPYGGESGLTGQQVRYKFGWLDHTASRSLSVADSVAARILEAGKFSKADTYVALVFDAKFANYELATTKKEILKAYYTFIRKRFFGSRLQTLYIGAHSRGGCLSYRLSSWLRRRLSRGRIIVQAFDPVCNKLQKEFGANKPWHHNPLKDGYSVYTTNMDRKFKEKNCLFVRSFLSGDNVILPLVHGLGHRGFSESRDVCNVLVDGKVAWYWETWGDKSHAEIKQESGGFWPLAVQHFHYATGIRDDCF